ncbi:lipopolysaccharide assembly protein LapA domain-containing protein [Nocardioides sp. TRM66260-LWL]|uniref:LapA family protein n=1 Tax=Nocardioides sp. TRM66260-LWL TaxID=2874478 RepID=UPI001CC3E021|nr:LapA family protein [Nocardioides sp. TRM66260-LWL]MBZ5733215.1 lipopolysaccharide assembly protein LapA domain-containing protein [Nocardioides sp. TRM66260-LWL]
MSTPADPRPAGDPVVPDATGTTGATGPAQPTPPAPVADPLRGSRTSGFYAATVGLGIVLVLLIIFIAQNTQRTTVRFLTFEGQASVAVVLLVATAAGILLTAIAGSLRIIQLRHRTKKVVKAERKRSR